MDDNYYMIENLENRRNTVRAEIDKIRRLAAKPEQRRNPTLQNRIRYLEALRKKLNTSIERLLYKPAL
jgi:hypothetical protein